MELVERTDISILMTILQFLIKPIGKYLIKAKKRFPEGSQRLTVPSCVNNKCMLIERQVAGIWIYDLMPKSTTAMGTDLKGGKRIYYFAGGAWQMPPSKEHWKLCVELAIRIPNTMVSLISYPLAPSSPAPETFPQLARLYGDLMRQSSDRNEIITLMGDSAGGNLAFALTLHGLVADSEAPSPHSLVGISPAVDLRPQDATLLQDIDRHDPLLNVAYINYTAKTWASNWDPADARLSPVSADVQVLKSRGVKVFGVTGSYDVLTPPALAFRDRCVEAGVEGEWLHWAKQMHCFLLTWGFGLREGRESKDWLVDVLSR